VRIGAGQRWVDGAVAPHSSLRQCGGRRVGVLVDYVQQQRHWALAVGYVWAERMSQWPGHSSCCRRPTACGATGTGSRSQ
jgi:hypothetical protein